MERKFFLSGVVALVLAPAALRAAEPALPLDYSRHPFIRQERSYNSGAAVLRSVLRYRGGFSGTEEEILPRLGGSMQNGTTPQAIVKAARELGLEAEYNENLSLKDLRKARRRGDSVIVDLQAWSAAVESSSATWKECWEDGHYVLLAGFDKDYAYFMDPALNGGYGYIPLPEFQERWHDYEDTAGKIWRHNGLAVFLRGGKPGSSYNELLQRIK